MTLNNRNLLSPQSGAQKSRNQGVRRATRSLEAPGRILPCVFWLLVVVGDSSFSCIIPISSSCGHRFCVFSGFVSNEPSHWIVRTPVIGLGPSRSSFYLNSTCKDLTSKFPFTGLGRHECQEEALPPSIVTKGLGPARRLT